MDGIMIYAEVTNGLCTNAVVCEDTAFAQSMGWIGPIDGLDPTPGSGWTYNNGEWEPPGETLPA